MRWKGENDERVGMYNYIAGKMIGITLLWNIYGHVIFSLHTFGFLAAVVTSSLPLHDLAAVVMTSCVGCGFSLSGEMEMALVPLVMVEMAGLLSPTILLSLWEDTGGGVTTAAIKHACDVSTSIFLQGEIPSILSESDNFLQ